MNVSKAHYQKNVCKLQGKLWFFDRRAQRGEDEQTILESGVKLSNGAESTFGQCTFPLEQLYKNERLRIVLVC